MTIAVQKGDSTTPLCVDLDGTLVRTDLLHEAVFMLLRSQPWMLFVLPFWLLKGRTHLKMELARRVTPDPSTLPYREAVLAVVREAKAQGRPLILATASPRRWADAVATHLDVFDRVEATSETVNLAADMKASRLVGLFGEHGFDYIGDSRADIAVWSKARRAFAAHNGAHLPKTVADHINRTDGAVLGSAMNRTERVRTWLKAVRVHQWLKNSLLFVPAILGIRFFDVGTALSLTIAFLAFSLCASAVYLVNDLLDMPVDRKHPTKRQRPFASGKLPVHQGAVASCALLISAFALALFLPTQFLLVLAVYFAVTCAYSLSLKRMLLIDVLTLAGLFTVRVLAGAAAVGGTVSTWLLAFCMFFFLSLALVKRFVELTRHGKDNGLQETGRGYRASDIDTVAQAGMASGFAAVVVLALFIESPQVATNYARPEAIWLVCPLVLYIIMRVWILARRQEMHDDPVVFLLTDWRSQAMIAIGAVIMLLSQIL
ncbi:MAG: UbiA family prenyltransferase [Pseudomonadota bacterium]